jgi:hypothetical protein
MPGITAARQFRVVALPLTTRTRTREALTYYHFVTAPPKSDKPPTVLLRAQNKASEIWAGFGKAEGGWKVSYPFCDIPMMPSSTSSNLRASRDVAALLTHI